MKRLASVALAGLLCSASSTATAMSHVLEFTAPIQPGDVVRVGVLSDGVPLTSVAIPAAPDPDGVFRVISHALYGRATSVVLFGANGLVSPASNAQVYGGCLWDTNGDGVVGAADFSTYLIENGLGTAMPSELASFATALGMVCL